jgi:hypothetical protein
VGRALLLNRDSLSDVVDEVKNLDKYNLQDFYLSVHFRKQVSEYSSGSLQMKLIQQYIDMVGRQPDVDQQVYYVKARGGYKLTGLIDSIEDIDRDYYLSMIENIIENLGVMDLLAPQVSIDDYF